MAEKYISSPTIQSPKNTIITTSKYSILCGTNEEIYSKQ